MIILKTVNLWEAMSKMIEINGIVIPNLPIQSKSTDSIIPRYSITDEHIMVRLDLTNDTEKMQAYELLDSPASSFVIKINDEEYVSHKGMMHFQILNDIELLEINLAR